MYRRLVFVLLLPCVLLTRSAVLGHGHGGRQPAGHALRPHIHITPPAGPRHHRHQHNAPRGHHHHHHHHAEEADPDTRPAPQPEPPSDHDSDAVFVGSVDVVLSTRSAPDAGLAPLPWKAAVSELSPTCQADLVQEVTHWTRPPPSGRLCPLYVRHLALLIQSPVSGNGRTAPRPRPVGRC